MDREIVLDKFLKHICENSGSFWTCIDYLKKDLKIDDYNLSTSVANEIVDRGWAKPSNYSNNTMMATYEGQQIIERYGSYSSFLRFENKRKISGIWSTRFTNAKTIITIITASGMFILAIIKFSDNNKIQSLETEIQNLNHINDSLNLQNDKYRNHLQRKGIQDTSLGI